MVSNLARILSAAAVVACCGAFARPVCAQPAQVVQLPTFNFFTVSTTVSAPDRGAISMGGVRSLREGSNTRGIPMLSKLPGISRLAKNRGIGRDASASSLSVHPFIISREEMEAELMADAAASRVTEPAMVAFRESLAEAARLSSRIGAAPRVAASSSPAAASLRPTPPGLAEIERRNAVARKAKLDEAMQNFRRGEKAEREGKPGVAKIYYKIAGRQGNAELQQVVLQRIRRIDQAKAEAQQQQRR